MHCITASSSIAKGSSRKSNIVKHYSRGRAARPWAALVCCGCSTPHIQFEAGVGWLCFANAFEAAALGPWAANGVVSSWCPTGSLAQGGLPKRRELSCYGAGSKLAGPAVGAIAPCLCTTVALAKAIMTAWLLCAFGTQACPFIDVVFVVLMGLLWVHSCKYMF